VAISVEVHKLWTGSDASPVVEVEGLAVAAFQRAVLTELGRAVGGAYARRSGQLAEQVTGDDIASTIAVEVVHDGRRIGPSSSEVILACHQAARRCEARPFSGLLLSFEEQRGESE
jgi:hypothetical protein